MNLNNNKKSGIELIAQERARQIDQEGFGIEHDKGLEANTLTNLAIFYAQNYECDSFFSKDVEVHKSKKLQKCRLRQLVVAGALIAAEIDLYQQKHCHCSH